MTASLTTIDSKKDFKDSCVGPSGPDWVMLIFANQNTSL